MTLDEIRTRVLNPGLPVDVEFEYSLWGILQTLRAFSDPLQVTNYPLQEKLCKNIRQALSLLENKIARRFGKDYRGGSGGDVLIELAEFATELLSRPGSDAKVKNSVNNHLEDIKKVNLSLTSESSIRHPVSARAEKEPAPV